MTDITDKLAEALEPFARAAKARPWIDANLDSNIGGSSLTNRELDNADKALAAHRQAKAQPQGDIDELIEALRIAGGEGSTIAGKAAAELARLQETETYLISVRDQQSQLIDALQAKCEAKAQPQEPSLPNQATVDEQLDAMVLAFAVERHFMHTPTPQDLERMAKKWKQEALRTFCSLAKPYLDKLREADANIKAQPQEPHIYSPSFQHMGDCDVCGNRREHPNHIDEAPPQELVLDDGWLERQFRETAAQHPEWAASLLAAADIVKPQEPGEFDGLVKRISEPLSASDSISGRDEDCLKAAEAITTLTARLREANEAAKWAVRLVEEAEEQVRVLDDAENRVIKLIDSIFPDETGGGTKRIIAGIKALKDQTDEATAKALEEAAQAVLDAGGDNVDYHADAIRALIPAGREEG